MKALLQGTSEITKSSCPPGTPARVCMHVLTAARVDVRVMREAAGLVKDGYAVSIVDVEGEDKQPAEEDMRGVWLKHVLMPGSFTTTRFTRSALLRAVQIFLRSTLKLIQTPADIYHAHDMTALPACYIASLVRGKRLIFDAHELPLSELNSSYMRWYHLRPLLRTMLRVIVPRCAGVITVSSPIGEELRELYHASNVMIVRNVPEYQVIARNDRLRQRLGLGPNVRIALYQGGIQRNRSLDRLVCAARYLHPSIVIVFMGPNEGSTQEGLEALIASEGVGDRVKILPAVSYEELFKWTASADIGLAVFARDYSLSIRWCLPNKLFEYLLAGLPVLVSDLEAMVEVVKTYDVGYVSASFAPVDIAAAINTMLADPDSLARWRSNALEAAKKDLCWEKESSRLTDLYKAILQSKRPRPAEVNRQK